MTFGTPRSDGLCRPKAAALGRPRTGVVVAKRDGKVGNLFLVFHFSSSLRRGCGNVGISRSVRDFQGAGGGGESLPSAFHAFHSSAISTALWGRRSYRKRGGNGDSIWHARRSLALAAPIRFAHAVSLMRLAILSNCTNPRFGFKYCSAFASDFSFSYGVA